MMRSVAASKVLEEFRTRLDERFGHRLRELIVFGSYARGNATTDSDIDVMVTVDGLTSVEAREVSYLAGDLLTEFSMLVSPFALSTQHAERLRYLERRIMQEIAADGVSLLRSP